MAPRRAERLAIAGIALTLVAVTPLYFLQFHDTHDYAIDFSCDPIGPDAMTVRLETVEEGSFIGMATTCVLTNLDRSSIVVETMLATATSVRAGPVIAFDPVLFAEQLVKVPRVADAMFPVTLNPYDAVTFNGVYTLPLPAGWDNGSEVCRPFADARPQTLSESALCLTMFSVENFRTYLESLRGAGEGSSGYSQFAVQVRFDNREGGVAPLELDPVYDQIVLHSSE